VVKWEGASTSAELRNVQEGQQAANLFTLPSAYNLSKPENRPTTRDFRSDHLTLIEMCEKSGRTLSKQETLPPLSLPG
jgi:hypothetical protein